MVSVTLSARHCITLTLHHLFLPTMKLSMYYDYYPHFTDENTEAKGSSVTSPRTHSYQVVEFATHSLTPGTRGCPGSCQISLNGRRVSGKAEETTWQAGSHRSSSFHKQEKGTEGSWKARLLACSLMALFRYNVVWQCGYKKRCSLKTGAAQALSFPKDFFCKLFCSLQETLGMLLRIKRKESHLLT